MPIIYTVLAIVTLLITLIAPVPNYIVAIAITNFLAFTWALLILKIKATK